MNKSSWFRIPAALLPGLLLLIATQMGCQWWGNKFAKKEVPTESSVYDDPSFDLPASASSRSRTSALPGGLSKEAREIEARLGVH